jgi:hypothetical protein
MGLGGGDVFMERGISNLKSLISDRRYQMSAGGVSNCQRWARMSMGAVWDIDVQGEEDVRVSGSGVEKLKAKKEVRSFGLRTSFGVDAWGWLLLVARDAGLCEDAKPAGTVTGVSG